MRRPALLLPAVAAAVLLTACGSEHAGTQSAGAGSGGPTSPSPVGQPAVDGVRITSVTIPSGSRSTSPSAAASASTSPAETGGGVRAERLPDGLPADPGVSAAYEVVNSTADALTYTVIFGFTTSTGGAVSNQKVTVRSVGAGRTVTGTVRLGTLAPGAPPVTRVKVAEVTRVPAAEAPSEPGVCPPSGIRITADDGDSAMGLRVVGLLLENCGTEVRTLDGYPRLSLLDDDLQPVRGVEVMKGSGGIATVAGFDDPPRAVTLKPGERASAGLMWRNTTGFGEAVDVPYVRVHATAGAAPVTVTPHLDLGTTGKLGVSPWRRTAEQTGVPGS
ncbi:DUF4232 domain-containing protein [Streptomyces sp. ID05-04B]|uniref:DUF4232 domain-containing protein n=1 Tax=Streptomyces sp. ID05-04B TaxID=3028661 RepID=UPI0029C53BA3|nr:DUF4232 domain-containing protein [Streptomyces sp. ID05-04B]MDX5568611.1 DUF4232 domain-containing protein [Streptomyces sp. ID05-04B]